MLKSRILGENPCSVDKIFRKIKQFGFDARQGGGVSGVEVALWDLAGKAYGVPIYQMLGGKFRDKIRCYADTDTSADPKEFAARLKARKDMGFTWLKMDLGIELVEKTPGTITRPVGQTDRDVNNTEHMFTGIDITPKGIEMMANFVAVAREAVGMEIPISADHFGHISVKACIKLGKALEKYNMGWLEDMIPWQRTDLWKFITDSIDVPTLTGEDIFLKEGFIELARNHAVDMVHPDVLTYGRNSRDQEDRRRLPGVRGAHVHPHGRDPIGALAAVHAAAATENFMVMEIHSVEVPWWQDLINGVEKPIMNKGFVTVPSGPGLGFTTLNEDLIRKHLDGGYFEPLRSGIRTAPMTAFGAAKRNPARLSGADPDLGCAAAGRFDRSPRCSGFRLRLAAERAWSIRAWLSAWESNFIGTRLDVCAGARRYAAAWEPGLVFEGFRNPAGQPGDLHTVRISRLLFAASLRRHTRRAGFSRAPAWRGERFVLLDSIRFDIGPCP